MPPIRSNPHRSRTRSPPPYSQLIRFGSRSPVKVPVRSLHRRNASEPPPLSITAATEKDEVLTPTEPESKTEAEAEAETETGIKIETKADDTNTETETETYNSYYHFDGIPIDQYIQIPQLQTYTKIYATYFPFQDGTHIKGPPIKISKTQQLLRTSYRLDHIPNLHPRYQTPTTPYQQTQLLLLELENDMPRLQIIEDETRTNVGTFEHQVSLQEKQIPILQSPTKLLTRIKALRKEKSRVAASWGNLWGGLVRAGEVGKLDEATDSGVDMGDSEGEGEKCVRMRGGMGTSSFDKSTDSGNDVEFELFEEGKRENVGDSAASAESPRGNKRKQREWEESDDSGVMMRGSRDSSTGGRKRR